MSDRQEYFLSELNSARSNECLGKTIESIYADYYSITITFTDWSELIVEANCCQINVDFKKNNLTKNIAPENDTI